MKKIYLSIFVGLAVMAAPLAAEAQVPVPPVPEASNGPQAPESDYAAFRALNEPYHLIDFIGAGVSYAVAQRRDATPQSQAWAKTVVSTFSQVLDEHRDLIVDTVMRHAFKGFSHDEVVRLTQTVGPPIDHIQSWVIDQMRTGVIPSADTVTARVAADPDFQKMSLDDRLLSTRFISHMNDSLVASRPLLDQIGTVVGARLQHQPEPKIAAPAA